MSSGRRGRRHHEEEEHENHERWLVTYADMVTLLMVLFIVMFAMSQVDEKKFMALKNGLAAGFANSASVLPGSDTLLEEAGTSAMSPVSPRDAVGRTMQNATSVDSSAQSQDAEQRSKALDELRRLRAIQAELLKKLAEKGLADDVRTTIDSRGLVVSLVSQHVVFQANLATLTPRGQQVVDALGPVLRTLPEDLQISGHTNQVAVKPKYFATDWDLSAARAVTVLRRLNEQLGIPEDRLSAAAYGDTRPLVDPSVAGSQRVNKRVDIVVLSDSDEQTRELVQQFAGDGSGQPAGQPSGQSTGPSTGQATGSTADSAASDEVAASSDHSARDSSNQEGSRS